MFFHVIISMNKCNLEVYTIVRSAFIPPSGISRISRWERAEEFNLDPPKNVYEILVQNQNNPKYTEW